MTDREVNLVLFGRRLGLRLLTLPQFAQRRIHPCRGNHRLIVRIRLQLLLLLLDYVLVLVPLAPLVIGRTTLGWIDVVLIGTLATHRCLAARVTHTPLTKHAHRLERAQRSPTRYFVRISRTLSNGIASAV